MTEELSLRRGERLVVAVSGGRDSMVLLHLLAELSGPMGWQLAVAHFNHRLRGRASVADERWVRGSAEALGLRCVCACGEVASYAVAHGLSVEMAARTLRHAFLARVAVEQRSRTVVLAHHADDQVETFLLRLLRGAGGLGLAGMRLASPSPANPAVTLVRPLLPETQASLVAYARRHRLRFREDASNASRDFLRNRVRHELLPLLRRRFQPAIERAVLRTLAIVGAEADHTMQSARAWLRARRRPVFARLHLAVQRAVLHLGLIESGQRPEFDSIERLRLEPERRFMLGGGRVAWRDRVGVLHVEAARAADFRAERAWVELDSPPRERVFGGVRLRWQLGPASGRAPARVRSSGGLERFDADRVGREVLLRHWQPGDRFQPLGMPRPVKLQDLFTNLKVPAAERRERVLATTRTGEIFWVEGLRMSEPHKLRPETARRLEWRWRRLPGAGSGEIRASASLVACGRGPC